ncbi:MAG: FixH family protein [Anaerolineae bacterium]|jgi:hypothetical protein|nr:FixH family protein [Anaerolineae bacterium]
MRALLTKTSFFLVLMLALAGCRESAGGTPINPTTPTPTPTPQVPSASTSSPATDAPPAATYSLTIGTSPSPAVAGEGAVIVAVRDSGGRAVANTAVQRITIVGNMNHAGMVPVEATRRADRATTRQAGTFSVPFNFNMGGDWILSVAVQMTDGTTVNGTLNLSVR